MHFGAFFCHKPHFLFIIFEVFHIFHAKMQKKTPPEGGVGDFVG